MNKKKIIGILIIIIGIVVLSLPSLSKFLISKKTDTGLENFEELEIEDIKTNNESEGDFNFDNVVEISPSKVLLNPGQIDQNLIVGQIVIPSIDLNLTIFKGLSENELFAGVGTMKPDQVMGEGNYAIAGHYAENNTLFGNLTSVKNGDFIKITDKKKIYVYEVFDYKIVDPSQVELIEDNFAEEKDKPIISLMNCYYENNVFTGNRYFVFGELVETLDYNKGDMINK